MKGQYKNTKASNPTFRKNYDKVEWDKNKPVRYDPEYMGTYKGVRIIYDPINYGVVTFKSR